MHIRKYNIQPRAIFLILTLFFLFSCDQEVSTSPPDPEPPQGFIYVESTPSDFQIHLDGRFTGRFTPDSLPYVEDTLHEITLKRKLWRDTSVTVDVKEGILATADINLLDNPQMYGNIKFVSNPIGAAITFRDTLLGEVTPYTKNNILPGVYKVKFTYPKHRAIEARISVSSSKTSNVSLTLRDTSIWVDHSTRTSPLPTNKLTCITVDNEDAVWMGTVDKGVARLKGNNWSLYNSSNTSLISDRVTTIFADFNDNIWVGTEDGLLRYRYGGSSQLFTINNSNLLNNYITSIDQKDDGDVWIGTLGGISKFSDNNFINYSRQNGEIPSGGVNGMEVIDPLNVWAAIDTFLTKVEIGNSYQVFGRSKFNVPNSNPKSIKQSHTGEIWVTFSGQSIFYAPGVVEYIRGGLGIYDGSTWRSIVIGGNSTQFPDIFIDSDNVKWVSSSMGLIRFISVNSSSAVTFRQNNSGILSENIKQVVEDSKGTLWIATNDGLAKYKKNLTTK